MRRAVDVAVETRRRRNFARPVRVDEPRAVDDATSRRGDVSDVFEFIRGTAAARARAANGERRRGRVDHGGCSIWRTGVHYM